MSIADLRTAVLRTLDVVEKRLGADVRLDVDHYWHLPADAAFNMTEEPQEFTTGQVSDDLDEAVRDTSERHPDEAWHELSHLVGVLRALEFAARF